SRPSIPACRCAAWRSPARSPSRRSSPACSAATRRSRRASSHWCAEARAEAAVTFTFSERGSAHEIEEGAKLAPKFDADGLVTCVATDAATGELLMVAHLNAEAFSRTIDSAEACYFSRSRRTLWRKGESSGHVQRVTEMRIDCDQDAVWIKVEQAGAGACHPGRRSCFYRAVPLGKAPDKSLLLEFREAGKAFDPAKVYGGKGDWDCRFLLRLVVDRTQRGARYEAPAGCRRARTRAAVRRGYHFCPKLSGALDPGDRSICRRQRERRDHARAARAHGHVHGTS